MGYTPPAPTADELRQYRYVPPDAQSQLLAEVFPGTRPESGGGLSPVREDYSRPDGGAFLRLEGGAEVVDNRFGFRLGAGGSLYNPSRRLGLRLDAAAVQGDAQREMLKLLLSAGAKLGEQNQLVFSAGWLNRYAWGNFSDMGDLGDNLSQYVVGMELERQITQRSAEAAPGIAASLSALYYKSESKTLWAGQRTGENDTSYYQYFYEYGLGGGSQYETLAGLRFSWKPATLELQAGFRHKEYEEYLGNPARVDDAPKASARLTLNQVLGNELAAYYTWDPDLKVAGASLRRPLGAGWSLAARMEMVQGEDRPDDLRYFIGLDYWFGGGKPKLSPRHMAAAEKSQRQSQEAEEDRREAANKGDWLRPVRGSESEYIQVMRQVQRKTKLWVVEKAGLAEGVTVDKKTGEIVVSGLPGATAVVLVTPTSASGAFVISGGLLRIAIAKLPETQDIMALIQQADGRYSMVRVLTSHGCVEVDSVQYSTNLTECQTAAIFSNPSLLGNPPDPAPVIGTIPEQYGTVGVYFSLDLTTYIKGSVRGYELTGNLPNGIIFDPATGLIFGKPSQNGVFYIKLRAGNSCGWSNEVLLTIIINSASGGGNCSPVISITAWTPNNANPDTAQAAFRMVDFTTNVAVTAGNITVTVNPDWPGDSVTTTVVNDDAGAGKQWHVNGDFTSISGSETFTLSITVRDACGNAATRTFNGNIDGM